MTLSPRTLIGLCAALTLFVCALTLSTALSVPATGLRFAAGANNSLVLADSNTRITALIAGDTRIPADGSLAIEEPDMLATYTDFNAFMATQSLLADALRKGRLHLEVSGGDTVQVTQRPRLLADLPPMFWLQMLFGVGGMMTGALVLAGRPRQRPAQLYALTGLGYLLIASAAAVYSTRELILDGELFRVLSIVNHGSALLFTGALTALLWSYPVRLGKLPMVTIIFLASTAALIADILQATPRMAQYHVSLLVIFALSFVFAGMQWWNTRHSPAERAALRWFLLTIYLATGLFAGVIVVPTALNIPPPASQGVMLGALLIMFWGLALGIVRYRLFQIAQWWRAIWWWFLGGLAVVLIDILLITSLSLSGALALSIAVAAVGWLYFPLRQWLLSRFSQAHARNLAEWLPDVLPLLIETPQSGSGAAHVRDRWPGVLTAVFRPLETVMLDGALDAPEIRNDGLALAIPDVRDPARHLELRCADSGQRLFTSTDLETFASLRELFDLALGRQRERDAGARIERERIRRDIHDDLGARLLTLLHSLPEQYQPMVREALDDLRTLLRALEFEDLPLRDATDSWQAEARKRCDSAGVTLEFRRGDIPEALALNARQHANLARVLREALSNALRHARPSTLSVDVLIDAGALLLTVCNDGAVLPLADWPHGRGRKIMQGRVAELGGTLGWTVENGRCLLKASVPLA